MRHRLCAEILACYRLRACVATSAQEYPTKPIRAIIPWASGGGIDVAARVVGQNVAGRWGQRVIVNYRGGAGGLIGTDITARAAPDGYTLLINSAGLMILDALLYALRLY